MVSSASTSFRAQRLPHHHPPAARGSSAQATSPSAPSTCDGPAAFRRCSCSSSAWPSTATSPPRPNGPRRSASTARGAGLRGQLVARSGATTPTSPSSGTLATAARVVARRRGAVRTSRPRCCSASSRSSAGASSRCSPRRRAHARVGPLDVAPRAGVRRPVTAYYGTDTRAQSLLAGAALACCCRSRVRGRRGAQVVVLVGLAALVVVFATVDSDSPGFFSGGFLLVAVMSAGLVAAAAGTTGPVVCCSRADPQSAVDSSRTAYTSALAGLRVPRPRCGRGSTAPGCSCAPAVRHRGAGRAVVPLRRAAGPGGRAGPARRRATPGQRVAPAWLPALSWQCWRWARTACLDRLCRGQHGRHRRHGRQRATVRPSSSATRCRSGCANAFAGAGAGPLGGRQHLARLRPRTGADRCRRRPAATGAGVPRLGDPLARRAGGGPPTFPLLFLGITSSSTTSLTGPSCASARLSTRRTCARCWTTRCRRPVVRRITLCCS